MKAIIRWSAGLLSLLLLGSSSDARVWISPVFKTPLPHAPSPSNSGFYLVDAYGRLTGPHYYLVPPCPPFGGMLPGPTGQAIMSGYLPHTLLLSKEGLAIGKVPLLGQKQAQGGPETPSPAPGAGMPQFAGGGPMPYPMAGGPNRMPGPNMQVPYGNMPMSAYPMQSPYPQPMPMPRPMPMPYAGGMPYPMPYQPQTPMMPGRPIAYMPYYGPPGMYATARQDPQTGIWQVQNVMPNQRPSPFMPIPGFTPGMPGPQMMQNGPMMPNTPMMPGTGLQPFGPTQTFDPFGQINGPQPPRMNWEPMQMPRMEMAGPPPQRPGMAYPTHPFTRSPRDFFMWGENMDEERARGSRPFPVP
jgi:hypothetical protein